MTVLAVIPARGGSKRIERKNMQVVGGMTLVERAWRCAVACNCFTRIVVSTDDDEIADHARALGADVRRRAVSGDGPMADVLLDALLPSELGGRVVCLQPTTPQRRPLDVWAALDTGTEAVGCHDSGHAWVRNGSVYVTHAKLLHRGLMWHRPIVVETPEFVDINTPEDLARVREVMG